MKIIEFTYQTDNLRLWWDEAQGGFMANFKNPMSGRWVAAKHLQRWQAQFHRDGTVSLTPSVHITRPCKPWHGWYKRGKYVKR